MKQRNIYIVTRRVDENGKRSSSSVPNLGVHSSLKNAIKHFDDIVGDRKRFGDFKIHWSRVYAITPPYSPGEIIKETVMSYRLGVANIFEVLQIEKWKV